MSDPNGFILLQSVGGRMGKVVFGAIYLMRYSISAAMLARGG
jgi:hypothetical protein